MRILMAPAGEGGGGGGEGGGGDTGGGDAGGNEGNVKKVQEAMEETFESVKKVNKEMEKTEESLEGLVKGYERAAEKAGSLSNANKNVNKALQGADSELAKAEEALQKYIDKLEESGKISETTAKLMKQSPKDSEELFNKYKKRVQETDKSLGALTKSIQGLGSMFKGLNAGAASFLKPVEDVLTIFSGLAKQASSSLKNLADSIKAGKFSAKDATGSMKKFMNSIVDAISPIKLFIFTLGIAISALLDIDKAGASVAATTQGNKEQFMALGQALQPQLLRDYAASVEDLSKSFNALRTVMPEVADAQDKNNNQILDTMMALGKLGAAQETQAKNLRLLSFTTGRNADQANEKMAKLQSRGMALGISNKEMAGNISQFFGQVMLFSDGAEEALLRLSKQSQITGVSIDKMLSISKKFNTFKEGADFAQKLNSVLGTSISQVDMFGKNLEERQDAVRDALMMATGGYDLMNESQRLAAAEILGFGDNMGMLAGFLGGTLTPEQQKAAAQAESFADAMEGLKEMASEAIPFVQELVASLKAELLENSAVQGLMTYLMDNKEGLINALVGIVNAIVYLIENWKGAAAMFIGLKIAMMAASMGAAPLSVQMGGLAIAAIILAAAFTILVGIMTQSNSPPLFAIFGVIAAGVMLLNGALSTVGPTAAMGAGVFLLLAGAASLVFYMMTEFVNSIVSALEALPTFVNSLPDAITGVYGLSTAFMIMAGSVGTASLALLGGTAAISALKGVMGLTGGTDFEGMIKAGQAANQMGEGVANMTTGIGELSAAMASLNQISENKSIVISQSTQGTTAAIGKGGTGVMAIPPKITVNLEGMSELQSKPPIVNLQVTLDGEMIKHFVRKEIIQSY